MPESVNVGDDEYVPKRPATMIASVSERTLVNLIRRGELTVYRVPGENRNYYSVAELEEVARRRVRPAGRRPVVGLPLQESYEAGARS